MPEVEVEVDDELVRSLLIAQFASVDPAAAVAPLTFLAQGWDNVLFRLGDSLIVRLPVRALSAPLVRNETRWLPSIAARLPVAAPAPVFVGAPANGYPWTWTIVPWIDGEPVAELAPAERGSLVAALAETLLALHEPAPADAPENPFRGVPLTTRADAVERRWPTIAEHVPPQAVELLQTVWGAGLDAEAWSAPPVWVHGDAHPLNLLHRDGELSGIIDFGDITSGDPANDLATAWWTFERPDRERFLDIAMAPGHYDDAAPTRAAAWATLLLTALLCDLPSRQLFAGTITHTLEQLARDHRRDISAVSQLNGRP